MKNSEACETGLERERERERGERETDTSKAIGREVALISV
jgi:hypothetical protein